MWEGGREIEKERLREREGETRRKIASKCESKRVVERGGEKKRLKVREMET